MRLSRGIQTGIWVIIGLNLLMAYGTIAIFMRMAPAIALIIERNERSLEAGEEMLTCLAYTENEMSEPLQKQFRAALARAEKNVTEAGERDILAQISEQASSALKGDQDSKESTIDAIAELTKINRHAMRVADLRAQRLGEAGAWGVVFMALCVLSVILILDRANTQNVIKPLNEIHEVLVSQRGQNTMVRCGLGEQVPPDIKAIYSAINELLDNELNRKGFAEPE